MDRWLAVAPVLRRTIDLDAAAFRAHAELGEDLLAGLGAKPDRDEQQARIAEKIFDSCRRLRSRFIHLHAEQVYDLLTSSRTEYHRLNELAFAAAERFPELVPTRAQIALERERIQAHKDGREIDQAIFFRGLLRSSAVGAHLADAMRLPSSRALRLFDEFSRDGSLELGSVVVERRGRAAHLTVNNPQCLNAEDDRVIGDIETAVDLALLDDQVAVGVVRDGTMTHPRYLGKRVFSAGINLKDLHTGKISFIDFLLGREFGYISKLVRGLLVNPAADALAAGSIQKPWVAAVDTFAIGGGMQLLLVFDRVIAADDAYFSLPAAQEGIIPGASNLRLSRQMGCRLARQIILSGRRIRATDAEARWLCDDVVPAGDVDAAIAAAVQELDNPAVVANRRLLNLAEEPPERFREYMAEFAYVQATRLYSRDVLDKVGQAWSRLNR